MEDRIGTIEEGKEADLWRRSGCWPIPTGSWQ